MRDEDLDARVRTRPMARVKQHNSQKHRKKSKDFESDLGGVSEKGSATGGKGRMTANDYYKESGDAFERRSHTRYKIKQ